ncbi:hypothetical protein MmiHf6_03560 [Methanimicrococcus hongohii]|uniref:Uncharacterized protein n=1 Tax=Methanimicrococcus hongohii TaxID=3028295 RepID=A0AA96ZS58_9EURY|nr:hypothetical protein MmiHf6_03560 [Methanimicrococcus sp. Hf6]
MNIIIKLYMKIKDLMKQNVINIHDGNNNSKTATVSRFGYVFVSVLVESKNCESSEEVLCCRIAVGANNLFLRKVFNDYCISMGHDWYF